MIRVGTSGWTIPAAVRGRFPDGSSQLARYARVFSCVEITSSFYRPHRRSTYERWASIVASEFRFALKVPKAITHERRLRDAEEPLAAFLDESAGLGEKRDVLLVQLAPSFAYDADVVEPFVASLRERYEGRIAWEPRHPSWFTEDVEALFIRAGIARVAADPAVVPAAAVPGGTADFAYVRWHGSPQVYSSAYGERVAALARELPRFAGEVWCIFDNTRLGAATSDALTLQASLSGRSDGGRTSV